MEPRENRYAIPLTTLVAGAYVPLTEQVVVQQATSEVVPAPVPYGTGGGDVDGDGD